MSATVLGCGHASQLMEINCIKGVPQVHLHFLTDEGEVDARVELCCHGCGASILLYYWEDAKRMTKQRMTKHQQIRDGFVRKHDHCPNREYERNCPNYRSSFETIDLRTRRRAADPLPDAAEAAGQSLNAGSSQEEAPRCRGR